MVKVRQPDISKTKAKSDLRKTQCKGGVQPKKAATVLHSGCCYECCCAIFSARQHAERAICYRPSVRLSVRLSVRPSVTRVDQSKTVERIIEILSPSDRPNILVDHTKALQCEKCVVDTWKCISCLGISDELFDELTATNLHWFCAKCEDVLFDGSTLLDPTDKITNSLDKKIDEVEQRLLDNFTNIEQQLLDRMYNLGQSMEKKVETDILRVVEDRLRKLEEKPCMLEEVQHRIELKVD